MDIAGLIAGSGWASGLNLYAVTLLLGIAGRLGWQDIPDVLTRTDVMITVAVLFAVEFAADKIPYFDNVWDAIHTVVRPVGAAALGYVLAGEAESIGQAMGAAVSAGLAFTAHSAKAATRAAVNVSPEPASNIALSLFEDGLAGSVVILAMALPVIAIVVVIFLAATSAWITTRLWNAFRKLVGRRAPA
jgi:hypothetical protein